MEFLSTLTDLFDRHYVWVFSGIGVPVVLFFFNIIFRKIFPAGSVIRKQSSKDNSPNYMSGGDIIINNHGMSADDALKFFPKLPLDTGVFEEERITRQRLKSLLKPYFTENKAIFDTYGPMTDERFNPESSMPELWQRKIQECILPNNERIVGLIQDNQHLLLDWEHDVFAKYKQHVNDFSAKHTGKTTVTGIPFPMEILTILE